ncbi:MAG: GAF domain-containing protein [Scytolyngbya sp. HA4215-MV1]|nr:GAF domain-containing protein [Scytolyngbya sp. HA4215-MV1]
MLELLKTLLSPSQYMPHGYCYLWQTPLVWLHVVSDALIAIAYFSIPAMLIYFVWKRKDIPFSKVFLLFGAFIIFCGTGHLLDIWTLWHPAYWLSGFERAITALISCFTALKLIELLPQFLSLKSPRQLEQVNQELEKQIVERRQAEDTLRQIVAGTAAVTGEEFFSALVKNLAGALAVDYAIVSQVVGNPTEALSMLALWSIDHLAEPNQYQIDGTPCGQVIQNQQLCYYPQDLQRYFPGNELLTAMNAESYVGMPLLDNDQNVIGNLCIIDTKPQPDNQNTRAIMTVFAARAAAELQRKWAEEEKSRAYEELEFRVQSRTTELMQSNAALATEIQERIAVQVKLQRLAEQERATSLVIQQLRQSLDLVDIFNTTTAELRRVMQCDRVLIYRFNPDWSGKVVAESVAEGWNQLVPVQVSDANLTQGLVEPDTCVIKQMDNPDIVIRDTYLQETSGGNYQYRGYYRAVSDIYTRGFDSCYLDFLNGIQARAYVTVPIFRGQQLWGLLAVYQNAQPRQWQEDEIHMVSQIGGQVGVAVQQAELLVQTQQQTVALKQAKETADAANRAKSEFLANMSHELRTPLNVVLGFAQLMVRDATLTPVQQRYLDIISRGGEHLLRLINDVLAMSKIEAGRIVLEETSFDLSLLLGNLDDMLRLRIESKGLQFEVICAAAVPQSIKTDESKLRQVLVNLLSNAIKFTETGSVVLRVSLGQPKTADPTEITLHFEVEDTGMGIAPHELPKLFQPFEQTMSGRASSEGTGLGLAISQKFVQLMGGNITVESQLGHGSCFCFDITVGQATKIAPSPKPAITQTIVGLAPNQPTYRILIAEDHPTNRLLLSKMLSLDGFELKEAVNGEEAIALWQQWQPDLIFMDMQMPIINGLEATQHIKSATEAQEAPIVIALTASAFDEQQQACFAAGCDDFIRKPFQYHELFTKMSQHLGVQYLYQDEPSGVVLNQSSPEASSTPASKQDLLLAIAAMPNDFLKPLYRAAMEGNDSQIGQLIQKIPSEQQGLRDTIAQLAENFQFDQLIKLIQSAKQLS